MPVFFWTSWNHPPTRIAASGYKRKHHDTVGSSAAGRPSRVINILQVLFLIIIRLPFVDLSEAVTSWMRKKTEFPKETSQQALRVRNHARVSMLEPGDFEMCLGLVVALQPCNHASHTFYFSILWIWGDLQSLTFGEDPPVTIRTPPCWAHIGLFEDGAEKNNTFEYGQLWLTRFGMIWGYPIFGQTRMYIKACVIF